MLGDLIFANITANVQPIRQGAHAYNNFRRTHVEKVYDERGGNEAISDTRECSVEVKEVTVRSRAAEGSGLVSY